MSFENNGLPTIVKKSPAPTKESSSRSRSLSRDKKDDKKDVSKSTPAPQPNIVKVPSRSRKIDPRMQQMLERGLEYVSKIEDPEKRNAILERIEKYQNGEYGSRDSDERKKRYEEYRKKRGK